MAPFDPPVVPACEKMAVVPVQLGPEGDDIVLCIEPLALEEVLLVFMVLQAHPFQRMRVVHLQQSE